MDLFFRAKLIPVIRVPLHRVLYFLWLAGLICGSVISIYAGDSFTSTMRAAPLGCVSIFGLLSVLLLPLLFSAFAVYICQIRLLFLIVFSKAFLFSFVAIGVERTYGSAGWLVCVLLLLSDGLSLAVLWWFWNRVLISRQNRILLDFIVAFITIAVIGSADYLLIVPFLADLIS